MAFIQVDASHRHRNDFRPAFVNVSNILYVTSSSDKPDADGTAVIVFNGGVASEGERLVTQQTAAQVKTLIDAALAP